MAVDRSELVECMRSNELFESLSNDDVDVEFLAERCERAVYSAGDAIVEEGDKGHTLIVLVSGTVRISKKTPAGEDFAVAILRDEDHPCFGELSLLDDEVRSASAIVERDAVVLTLTRDAFQQFAAAFPAQAITVYRRLGRMLSRRLRGANEDIVTLFQALLQEIETQSIGSRDND